MFVAGRFLRKRCFLDQAPKSEFLSPEGGVQRYFSAQAERLGESPVLAFDSTIISTYSENQSEARRGFNKDGDGLKTIKLLTLYSVKAREPLAFSKQPGNIPDVISIENTMIQLKSLNLEKPLIVTDNGYYSQKTCWNSPCAM